MKSWRSAVVVVLAAAMVAGLAAVSFANGMECGKDCQKMCQEKIKTLKDSASILQKTNPELAKGLNELAAAKEKMLKEMQEINAKHEVKEKMLRDSAAALQKTNPALAKKLWDMSEYKEKGRMGGHMRKGKHGCSACGVKGSGAKEEAREEAQE